MAVIHYQSPLGTLANLQTAATAGQLIPRKLYGVQDGAEYAIAQATSASAFVIVGRGAVPPDPALVSAIRAGTGDGYLSPPETWGAMAPVALTDAPNIALNLALGMIFTVTIGGNRTFANPTSVKPGQPFMIDVTISGTRTSSFGSNWIRRGGGDPPTTGGYVISGRAVSASRILYSIAGA